MFLSSTVTADEAIQLTRMEMYISLQEQLAYFFIYTLKEVKGLMVSVGIQWFSRLKHIP